jgi:hypothetical protein
MVDEISPAEFVNIIAEYDVEAAALYARVDELEAQLAGCMDALVKTQGLRAKAEGEREGIER